MEHREIEVRKRLAGRMKFVDGPFDLQEQLVEIGTGVLFFRAVWSAQCVGSYRVFCNAVIQTPADSFAVHIVDCDHCDPVQCMELLGAVSHGYGETFWIKDGVVKYRDRGCYLPPVARLLSKRILEFSGMEVDIPGASAENDFANAVMKNCEGFPPDRIETNDLDCREIRDLELAVIVLYSPLTLPLANFRQLVAVLQENIDIKIRLIVLHGEALPYGDVRRIYGEEPMRGRIYWIKNGKIIALDDGLVKTNQKSIFIKRIEAMRM